MQPSIMSGRMKFLDRQDELSRLDKLARSSGLAVVFGRRRVGKTRLLLEWVARHDGVYFVADQSSALLQREAFASALGRRLPGFADVTYPSWRGLLDRLVADARLRKFKGPVVIDELPYLVATSPELPSVLQAWLDHEARSMSVALAGSSQRMMQGLALDASAPLYGRASEVLEVHPLGPAWVAHGFPSLSAWERLQLWTCAGGVPRYWELLERERGPLLDRLERMALDPMGPLHQEPDRLLLEEDPPAVDLRPLLEAIGGGAHRLSEIAARIGKPATSLSRPFERLLGLGLVRREVPFGETPRDTRRSLYRLADPFLRAWFRLVAPQRGLMLTSSSSERRAHAATVFPHLIGEAWEELARQSVPALGLRGHFGASKSWLPAARWWQGNAPEWDVVSANTDGTRLLLGEVKAWERPASLATLRGAAKALKARQPPMLRDRPSKVTWSLFVPRIASGVPSVVEEVHVVTANDVLLPTRAR